MTSALELREVSKSVYLPDRTELPILHGVNLVVAAGQTVSITGRSGSGKSTLLSVMGLLSEPTTGTVTLGGADPSVLSDARKARLRNVGLGFIFQNYSLVPTWTVLQNCQLPLLYRRDISPSQARGMAISQLAKLGLADRIAAYPRQLSGGEQQRVAIARALVRAPDLILADEPTGALDEATATTVLELLLQAVTTEGCSLILVTHDTEVAARADTRYELSGGALQKVSS